MKWMALALLLAVTAGGAPDPAEKLAATNREKASLTRPRVGIVLASLYGTTLQPAMAVLTANLERVYFTHSQKTDDCLGQDIWEISLGKGSVPKKIAEIACVLQLSLEKHSVVVRWKDTARNILYVHTVADEGKVVSFAEAYRPEFPIGQWQWKKRLLAGPKGVAPFSESEWLGLTFRDLNLVGLRGSLGDVASTSIIHFSLKESDSLESPAMWNFGEMAKEFKRIDLSQITWRDFHLTSYGWALLTYRGKNTDTQMGGFFLVDPRKGKIVRRYGAAEPYQSALGWDSLSAETWAVREPDYSALSPMGMLFYDQTPNRGSEVRAISYFSPWTDSADPSLFTRVKGLPEYEISGISTVNGGLLVSFGPEQTIAWFGAKNIFDENVFRSRRPNLREMSAPEYRVLLGEVK